MKLRMFVYQLEDEDLCRFPHLGEQSVCSSDHGSLAKYTHKIKFLQVSYESCLHDLGKDEDFIGPFSHSEIK